MLDTGLPARIRAKGVEVEVVPGWQIRGSSSYNPKGSVNHHTAGSSVGVVPSLGICTYGRADLPGPLCQVLQGRDDKAYVIAAGRANHAGSGGWKGLSGNSSVSGLEIEHTGTASTTFNRLDTAAKIQAALLEAPGSTRNSAYVCQHFEWTSRKIDFYNLAPHFNVNTFRTRVQYWIGRSAEGEDDMYGWTDEEFKTVIRNILKQELPALVSNHVPAGVQTAIVKGGVAEASFEKRVEEGVKAAIQTGGMAEGDAETRVNEALVAVLTFEAGSGDGPIHEIVRQVLAETTLSPEPGPEVVDE